MKIYEFHSRLPPEELKKRLDWEIVVENFRLEGRGKVKARWKGMKLRLNRWDSGVSQGAWVSKTATSFHASAKVSAEAYAPDPFRGEIFPDGTGGSVLRGGIVLHWGSLCLIVGFAVLTFLAVWPCPWWRVLVWEALIVGFIGGIIVRDYIRVLPGSRALLKFLDEIFARMEDE